MTVVTRRTMLKAIAAAMSVPIIDLRAGVPREKLLLDFCDADYLRYNLKQPFAVGSLTYATDSRAMIRTELIHRSEVGEMRIPPVGDAWRRHWNPVGQWRELDEKMMTPTIVNEYQLCPKCGDARISYGEAYPDNPTMCHLVDKYGYDVDDNTLRDRSCDVCHGLDYTDAGWSNVCGLHHSSFMLKRIAALPNPRVCRSGSEPDAILFRADGFEGISKGWYDDERS